FSIATWIIHLNTYAGGRYFREPLDRQLHDASGAGKYKNDSDDEGQYRSFYYLFYHLVVNSKRCVNIFTWNQSGMEGRSRFITILVVDCIVGKTAVMCTVNKPVDHRMYCVTRGMANNVQGDMLVSLTHAHKLRRAIVVLAGSVLPSLH